MNINTILRNTILGGIFIIPFIPFFVSQSMLFPFITGKNFAFRIIVEIIFALWVILALRDEEFRPRFSWLLASVGLFTLFVGLADIFAENSYKAFWSNYERMEGFVTILHLFLYFITVSSVLHLKRWWDALLATWFGSSILMCLYALLQLSGNAVINQGGVRVDGRLGNATYLAVFLLVTFFFGLTILVRKVNDAKNSLLWFFVPALILQLIVLYYTATRGAILGLIGGAVVTGGIMALFSRDSQKVRKAGFISLGVVVLVLGIFFSVRNTEFVKTSPVLSRFASLSVEEVKTQGRFFIWPMAIEGFKERPLLGWGQDGFNHVFNAKYDPRMYAQEQWFDRAHSVPLDWLVATGILGFLGYLSMLLVLYYYIWKGKDGGFSLLEKSLFTGLLSAYIFQGLFVFDNLVSYILFFSLLAMFHSFSGGKKIHIPHVFTAQMGRNVVAAVVVVLFATSFYFFNWKPIRASQTMIDALTTLRTSGPSEEALNLFEKVFAYNTFGSAEAREQLATSANLFGNAQVSKEVQQRFIEISVRELSKQVEEAPRDARYRLFRGVFYRAVGDNQKALEDLYEARKLSPRKQTILFELGTTLAADGKKEEALKILQEAWELEPSNMEARMILGLTALSLGEEEIAKGALEGVSQGSLYFDDRFVGVLAGQSKWNELVRVFSYRIENGADTVDNNVSLAVAYLKIGNRARSIEVLKRVAGRDPQYKQQMEYFIGEIEAGRDPSQ